LALTLLVSMVALLLVMGLAGTTTAGAQPGQDSGLALAGTLRAGGQPVAGATITVTDADDAEVGTAESAADGTWSIPVPEPGQYTIVLDAETLPAGVALTEASRGTITRSVGTGTTPVPFPLRRDGGPTATTQPDSGAPGGTGGEEEEVPASVGADLTSSGAPLSKRLARAGLNGIQFGLIIAMTSIGLSLIYGTTSLVNFAHGEMVTFGAIAAWALNREGPQIHLVWATLLAIVAGALLGGVLERGLWRPLRERHTRQFQLLVISIGLSLLMRPILLIWFGSSSQRYAQYSIQDSIDLGIVSVTPRDLSVMALSVVCLIGVGLLLQRTRIGKAMRAVSDNADLAESSGIDVRRVVLFVWVVGGALAAAGGVFQGIITSVNYLNGQQLLLLMFAGVILGGLGTAYGAMVGSIVVGLATEISTVWLNPELKYVWALVVLVGVMLVRPQGILGSRERVG
jgi:branched-chain amino acid transport system permease protein